MQTVDWTDHQLAKKIKKYNLSCENKTCGVTYYYSENYKMEILVIYNDQECTRKIVYSLK